MTKKIIMLSTAIYAETEAKKYYNKNAQLYNIYADIVNRYNRGEHFIFSADQNNTYSILNEESDP